MNEQYGGDNTPAENEFTKYGDDRYILDGRVPVQCPDLRVWGRWMQMTPRHVARTTVKGCDVSTVFLGLDHNYTGCGPPVLFETMVLQREAHAELARVQRLLGTTKKPAPIAIVRARIKGCLAAGHVRVDTPTN